MHVLWGPWKERARLGMGITGMSGPDEPLAGPAHDSVEAAWVDDMALLRDVARGLKFGVRLQDLSLSCPRCDFSAHFHFHFRGEFCINTCSIDTKLNCWKTDKATLTLDQATHVV